MTRVNMRIKLMDNVTRQPISDAQVIFRYLCIDGECYNEHELVSNSNGYVYFTALSGTRYDGRINAIGYEKRNFDFIAPAIATTITYNMTPGTPVDVPTLHVFVKANGNYLGTANVTVQGVTRNTDVSGSAKFDMPHGTYTITATATGFSSKTITHTFSAGSMTAFINLTSTALPTIPDTPTVPGIPGILNDDDKDGFDWMQWLDDNKMIVGIVATVTAGLILFYLTRGK